MSIKRKLRVLIVDDSYFFREIISMEMKKDKELEVVGSVSNGLAALKLVNELKPDVITLDIEMPGMNGIQFLKKLMPTNPTPVVVISAVDNIVFDALEAGAVDFIAKADARPNANMQSILHELVVKVKIAATANVKRRNLINVQTISSSNNTNNMNKNRVIAIGASTGGTDAILEVIKGFSMNTPGIVIVQHMPPVFTGMYAERLNNILNLEVKEAKSGDIVKPGRVLIAPGGKQMKLVRNGTELSVYCYDGEKFNGHAPSVDVLFDSVANIMGANAIGVILTGMGKDGSNGLLKMKQNGARTVGQDEKSCIVYGMPKAAYDIGAVDIQVDLKRISKEVNDLL